MSLFRYPHVRDQGTSLHLHLLSIYPSVCSDTSLLIHPSDMRDEAARIRPTKSSSLSFTPAKTYQNYKAVKPVWFYLLFA